MFSCGNNTENDSISLEAKQSKSSKNKPFNPVQPLDKNLASSGVVRISDPAKVKELKDQLLSKIEAQKQLELKELKNKSIGIRYKAGDTSVVKNILELLKSTNKKEKNELYEELAKRHGFPAYSIKEKVLIECIFSKIEIADEEKMAIQLAGIMNLPDHSSKFEARLLAGQSLHLGRLFFWLGKKGTSLLVLNKVEELLKTGKISEDQKTDIISGLVLFGKNGNKEIQRKVGEIAIAMFNKKLIPEKEFDDLKKNKKAGSSADNLLNCIYNYGDKKIVPIASSMLKKGINEAKALTAMVRINGTAEKTRIFNLLQDPLGYDIALEACILLHDSIINSSRGTKDYSVVKEIFVQLEKHKKYSDDRLENVTETIIKMNATDYLNELNTVLRDKELTNKLKVLCELSVGQFSEVAKDMYDMGLVSTPYNNSTIEKARGSYLFFGPSADVYNFLSVSGLFLSLDTVFGRSPLNYDKLIKKFADNSNGNLKGMMVWMDAQKDPSDTNKYKYKITIILNEQAYLVEPKDKGYSFEISLIVDVINQILKDQGSEKYFHRLKSENQTVQYLFGKKNSVNQFTTKYGLNKSESSISIFPAS
jgi:hypothetical protein